MKIHQIIKLNLNQKYPEILINLKVIQMKICINLDHHLEVVDAEKCLPYKLVNKINFIFI